MTANKEKLGTERGYNPEIYWEDLLSRDFSLTGVGYQGLGSNYNGWLYRARKRILEWFLKRVPLNINEISILDLGCGTGFYIEFWKKKGAKNLTGLDLTQKSVSELSRRFADYSFYKGDIGDRDLNLNKKFDMITAFDILFHIVDEERFSQAIHNVGNMAREGAIILISDNFLRYDREKVFFGQNNRSYDRYRIELDKNNIEIVRLKPIFYLMNGPIDMKDNILFRIYCLLWSKMAYLMGKSETLGQIIGFSLYYIDDVLIRLFQNSITTELLVCRKRCDH